MLGVILLFLFQLFSPEYIIYFKYSSREEFLTVTADEMDKIICNLKKSKAAGPDNLISESLI